MFSGKKLQLPVSFTWYIFSEYINDYIFKINGLPLYLNIPTESLSEGEANEINQRKKGVAEARLLYFRPE